MPYCGSRWDHLVDYVFYSSYTNWVLWGWSNIKLRACPLCGPAVEKYWKAWFIAWNTAESIKHHSQFFIPPTLFLFWGTNITDLFFFFLFIFAWTTYLTSTLSRVAVQISLLGFGLILSYQLKDKVNDLIWRPDYQIFSGRVAALTHRGQSAETVLINSAGGSLLPGK